MALYLPYEFENVFAELSDEEVGKMVKAIMVYDRTGEEPNFDGILRFAWRTHIEPKMRIIKENYERKCKQNKENVNKRWKRGDTENKKNDTNDTNVNEQIPNDTNVDDIDIDRDIDIEKDKDKDIKNTCAFDNGFELFWNEYPKHKGKPVAEKAFNKAIKKIDIDTMLEAIRKQKQSAQWKKENGQYIPYPATWLNQERWADEDDKEKYDGVLEALEDLIDD